MGLLVSFRVFQSVCSAHLVNCASDQMRCAANQYISCAAFDELRNIWSIAQRTCNRVRDKVRIRVRVRARARVSFRVRVRPNVQRIWSNAQIDQMHLAGSGVTWAEL